MLPVDLFRRPVFSLSVATSICSFTAQTLAYVSLPFLFEDVAGRSQIATGLLITPWPAIVVFVAPVAGRLSDRSSPGALGAMGLAIMTVGMLLLVTDAGARRVGGCGVADGGVRLRVRVLSVAEQPAADRFGAAGTQRRSERDAVHRAASGADERQRAGGADLRPVAVRLEPGSAGACGWRWRWAWSRRGRRR